MSECSVASVRRSLMPLTSIQLPAIRLNMPKSSASVTAIHGRPRLEMVVVTDVVSGAVRELPCDVSFRHCPESEWEIGPARIRAASVTHRGPTLGYRIDDGAASLAYIPDHEPALGRAAADERVWRFMRTHASEPVLQRRWLSPGTHVTSVGAALDGPELDQLAPGGDEGLRRDAATVDADPAGVHFRIDQRDALGTSLAHFRIIVGIATEAMVVAAMGVLGRHS